MSNHHKKSSSRQKSAERGRKRPSRKAEHPKVKVEGIVSMNRDGLGFITTKEYPESIFVGVNKMRGALNGDRVKVGVYNRTRSGRLEGEVVCVLERSRRPHIGTLHIVGNKVWAIVESRTMPYDIRIQVASPEELPVIGGIRAENGVKVAVLVTEWPKGVPDPLGRIVDVLGQPGENDTEMHSILAEYGLPYRFEPEVESAADRISEKITPAEVAARRDFRAVTTFTIDPSDAKDFDDALSFRDLGDGQYEVGIHIADVSHYVRPGSAVDREAYARGTSVYLVDRTVPMLPEKLCNKLCSLRPHEDKLCFSAVFCLDDQAKVHKSWFGRTVINSDERFDYEQAQQIIDSRKGPLAAELCKLNELAGLLRRKRFEAGAISFERPEMKVLVDEKGRPVDVVRKESHESNHLIEEFMLLANRSVAETVAKKCKTRDPAFVYRIHDNPNPEKIEELRRFAHHFQQELGDTSNPKKIARSLNDLMGRIKGRPEENAVQLMALRSMARACYSTDNIGHYGLAFPYYTHFTSPIRRYPDLMVHRLLALYLDGAASQDKATYEEWCRHASEREQLATEAERASVKYKMVEFMQDKIGREFDGEISGLTEWGIYVEIEPTRIEGMIALRDVEGDYLSFDAEKYQTVSHATGKVYTLGDKVRVRVLRASLEQKLLDFELVRE